MLVWMIGTALAGWQQTAQEGGCTYFKGDAEGQVVPIRAECDWPVDADTLHRMLEKGATHDDYFSSLSESRLISAAPGGGELVYQVHQASGISDREIVLKMTIEDMAGGKRYRWSKNDDQAGLSGKQVEIERDDGMWEVTATPEGVHVVYELRYLAGGSVPGFLVRWFQGAGVRELVGELRASAEKRK